MTTNECINRLLVLEEEVNILRLRLENEGKHRLRMENWLKNHFEDYCLDKDLGEDGDGYDDNNDEYNNNADSNEYEDEEFTSSTNGNYSKASLIMKGKRKFSTGIDLKQEFNNKEDIKIKECGEDLSPKRFKLPPLQQRPDVSIFRKGNGSSSSSSQIQEKLFRYRNKEEFVLEPEDPQDLNEGILWKHDEEVEEINVEPCLDLQNSNDGEWDMNGGEDDEDEDDNDEVEDNNSFDVVGYDSYESEHLHKPTNRFISQDQKRRPSQEMLLQQVNSGPPKLIAMKPGSLSLVSLKSINRQSNVPSTSHNNVVTNSSTGSSRVFSLSEVVSKSDRSLFLQGSRSRVHPVQMNVVQARSKLNEQQLNAILVEPTTTKLKAGECPHCGKTFNTPAEMMRHTRIHTGEKPYRCYECTYATSFNGDLVRHLKSRHPGMDPYVCHLCEFKCQELLMFNNHRRRTGHGGRGANNGSKV